MCANAEAKFGVSIIFFYFLLILWKEFHFRVLDDLIALLNEVLELIRRWKYIEVGYDMVIIRFDIYRDFEHQVNKILP